MTKGEWLAAFNESPDQTPHGLCKLILSNIDGYAIEYGIDEDCDAWDLEAAFEALQEFKQRKID